MNLPFHVIAVYEILREQPPFGEKNIINLSSLSRGAEEKDGMGAYTP